MLESIAKSESQGQAAALLQSWRKPLVCLVLAVWVALAYAQIVHCEFVDYDDGDYITNNPPIQHGVTWQSVCWAFTTGWACNWHPLTWISHMVDFRLFGTDPVGFHVENVLFHIANSILLFLFFEYITAAFWRSAILAGFFALHPFHVESVAWASERKDVLSTLFWILSAWMYCAYARFQTAGDAVRARRLYGGSLIAFGVGLLAKPMLVTLPCILFLLDYWPLRRAARWTRLAAEKIPYFVFSFGASVTTLVVQQEGGAMKSLVNYTLKSRVENTPVSYARYLEKTFWPSGLKVFYAYIESWPAWIIGVSCAALIVVSVLVFRRWRAQPYLTVGWLWFLGMLVPTIGIIQVGEQSMADRYSYLSSVGIFIMVIWGAAELAQSRPWLRLAGSWAAVAALAACSALTFLQVGYWRNSATLFGHATEVGANNDLAYYNLGCYLAKMRDPTNAIIDFQHAIDINPKYPRAYNNLAYLQLEKGELSQAISNLNKAVALRPAYPEALANLGRAQAAKGHADAAIASFEASIRSSPTNVPDTRHRLGMALLQQRSFDRAVAQLKQAVSLRPREAAYRVDLAGAWLADGKITNAVNEYEIALKLNPNITEACNNLAWIMAASPDPSLRDGPLAVELARHAVELTGASNPFLVGTFAAACAEAGRFDEAVRAASQARALALARTNSALAASLSAQIQLYQGHKPFRDPNAQ